jgi:hypothetical protein
MASSLTQNIDHRGQWSANFGVPDQGKHEGAAEDGDIAA